MQTEPYDRKPSGLNLKFRPDGFMFHVKQSAGSHGSGPFSNARLKCRRSPRNLFRACFGCTNTDRARLSVPLRLVPLPIRSSARGQTALPGLLRRVRVFRAHIKKLHSFAGTSFRTGTPPCRGSRKAPSFRFTRPGPSAPRRRGLRGRGLRRARRSRVP